MYLNIASAGCRPSFQVPQFWNIKWFVKRLSHFYVMNICNDDTLCVRSERYTDLWKTLLDESGLTDEEGRWWADGVVGGGGLLGSFY